jgi:hypothetical protein
VIAAWRAAPSFFFSASSIFWTIGMKSLLGVIFGPWAGSSFLGFSRAAAGAAHQVGQVAGAVGKGAAQIERHRRVVADRCAEISIKGATVERHSTGLSYCG